MSVILGPLRPLLTVVDCGPLPVPHNGSYHGTLTVFPNEFSFECDEGFLLKGSPVRMCQANGLWSGNNTNCEGLP